MPEHLEGVFVIFGDIDPDAVQFQVGEGFVEQGDQSRGAVMVMPQVFAANEDKELGLFEGPFDQQLAFADVGFIGGVDGVDAALVLIECMVPFGCVGVLDGFGGISDVEGVAVGVVVAIPEGTDFGVAQPVTDAGDVFAGNVVGEANLGEHMPASSSCDGNWRRVCRDRDDVPASG